MTPESADSHRHLATAYIHIPFCSEVCPYCDFAVVAGRDDLAERYVDAVCSEITAVDPWQPLDAVYFGGGTPSHIDPRLLARIVDVLRRVHGIAEGAEVTLEANPEDFERGRAKELLSVGFNRVSFGAQSFDGTVLASLGRRHQASHIAKAVAGARDAGFANVSLDLIYGTPGETDESWLTTLNSALALRPDHVSCYALTVERGTPLGRAVSAGAPSPDPDVQADRYEVAESVLGEAGLDRYEVSNWSRLGFECRYNLTVWAQGEYEAYGNGAHGFRNGLRFRNVRRLDAYLDSIEIGGTARAGEEEVSGWNAEVDRLFVGLRRTVGVSHGPGTSALLESDDGRRLVEAGVLELTDGRLCVSKPLLTDAVHRALLYLDRGGRKQQVRITSGDTDA